MAKHPAGYLSPHFNRSEFDCHDGHRVPADHIPALKKFCHNILEPARAHFGSCTIISGYRTAAYNAGIPGAASNSWHIYDHHPGQVAADLSFETGNQVQWKAWARANGVGGVGTYGDGHQHWDSGPVRDWNGA